MRWKVLHLDVPHVPHILAKWSVDALGYRIQLTDLSRIWSESLNSEEIISRALSDGCSIDPSEDQEQFKILVGKIRSALEGEHGTTLSISKANGVGDSDLQVDITASLPHPLPLFKWTLFLQRQPEEYIETELVTPLLLQASHLQQQIQRLVDELHSKDRVISKICDRLETSGNDLTTVFPGVSNIKTSRKKGQREQLARHVKGLKDFDEGEWKTQSGNLTVDGMNAGKLDEVFRDLPPTESESNAPSTKHWWEQLGRGSNARSESKISSLNPVTRVSNTPQRDVQESSETEEESLPDDEFQRQGTPPRLKSNGMQDEEHLRPQDAADLEMAEQQAPVEQLHNDDSVTEDEDDLDSTIRKPVPTQKLPNVEQEKWASHSPKKLGAIGGRAAHKSSSSPPTQSPEGESQSSKPRSKLGLIGGKLKSPPPASLPIAEAKVTNHAPPKKSSKMGTIGGKKAAQSTLLPSPDQNENVPTATQEPSPWQSRTPGKAQTPPPRETSEERADKKRDQLKRELEEKARAPVKKKRKF